MKGVSYLTDELNQKKAVVIDISTLENYTHELEDLLDGLIAESRKDDEKIPLEDVISNLKKSGKLKGNDTMLFSRRGRKKTFRNYLPL